MIFVGFFDAGRCFMWLEATLELVRDRMAAGVPLSRIAAEAGVPQQWLHKVVAGQTPNPGILKVQKVHDALAGDAR